MFIINPHSGKGESLKIFNKQVKPILDQCNIVHELLITEHANHASQFIESHPNLGDSYFAVVTLSGDGLLYEVLNGFTTSLERESGSKKVPVYLGSHHFCLTSRLKLFVCTGIIPGGSGNGLFHSINHIYTKGHKSHNQLFDSIMHIIKGEPTHMDIVRFTTMHNKVHYSFLSFGWGLMADIDIESERLRFIGETRFSIWSIYRSLRPRKYSGTLSYLTVDHANDYIPPLDAPLNERWVTIKDEFYLVYASYQQFLNSTCKFAPDARLDDNTIYLLYINTNVTPWQLLKFLILLEDGSHIDLPYVNFIAVKSFRLEPDSKEDIMTIDGEQIACSSVQAEIEHKMASILLRSG